MTYARTPSDHDRMTAALSPVDQAFRESERRWGVARLETLVSQATLESYRRGWVAYRKAIEDGDVAAVEAIAPKMVAALAYMGQEAEAAGHQPLEVNRFEATLEDGRVLVIVRTMPEAHAIARDKSDSRELVVYTMAEIARLIGNLEIVNAIKISFPGAEIKDTTKAGNKVASGVQMTEGQVADWSRAEPLYDLLHGGVAA